LIARSLPERKVLLDLFPTVMCLESPLPLARSFFARNTLVVARELLGCRLIRQWNGVRLSGQIVETEAYIGEDDQACHARAGRTPRTAVMYEKAGLAYVYFTYGMHWMLNVITEQEGFPAAVLIRALQPIEGIETMKKNRGDKPILQLCNGPAKLTQALAITRTENGLDMCRQETAVHLERGKPIPKSFIGCGPRIGIASAEEPWLSKPWRFYIKKNSFVSR
jgi:DNA-3-methyladenine glycosylase